MDLKTMADKDNAVPGRVVVVPLDLAIGYYKTPSVFDVGASEWFVEPTEQPTPPVPETTSPPHRSLCWANAIRVVFAFVSDPVGRGIVKRCAEKTNELAPLHVPLDLLPFFATLCHNRLRLVGV
jgi:hypothetical protein